MKYLNARKTKNSDGESNEFLYINNCGAFIDANREMHTSRPDGRMDYQLIYVKSGCIIDANGETAKSGTLMLFRPHTPQIYRVEIGTSYYWIHFSGAYAERLIEFFKENVYNVGDFSEFCEFCEETVSDFAEGLKSFDMYAAGRLISLVALITRRIESEKSEEKGLLRAVIFDMHTNFTVMRTNDEYAKMCGLSKSHFIRLFTAKMKMSPQKYRTFIAMREAKHLLKSNSVGDVAAMLGYDDVFYFSRVFKKHVGEAPVTYRNTP